MVFDMLSVCLGFEGEALNFLMIKRERTKEEALKLQDRTKILGKGGGRS